MYIIIWFLLLKIINTTTISVKDETELNNGFTKANNKKLSELIIKINENTIELNERIEINCSVKKLKIIGNSKDKSILKFNDYNKRLVFINSNYNSTQEIIFANLTIYGRTELYNVVNVKMEDISIYGSLYIDNGKSSGEYYDENYISKNLDVTITITRLLYMVLYRSINLIGNVIINDSQFYGHGSSLSHILNYNGEYKNSIGIYNSYINGMHSNGCLSISAAYLATVESTSFENGASSVNGGGGILLNVGHLRVKNCDFRNIYSSIYGGAFFFINPLSVTVEKVDVYNSTAIYGGSLSVVNSGITSVVNINLIDINLYGAGLIDQPIAFGGIIAQVLAGKININISNFYGEDLRCGKGFGLFLITDRTSVDINNIELHRVTGPSLGSMLVYSYSNAENSYFHITNGTIIDVDQDPSAPESTEDFSGVILATEKIDILLKNCIFKNFDFYGVMFIYTQIKSNITLENVYIDKYKLVRETLFIISYNNDPDEIPTISLKDVTISNTSQITSLVYSTIGNIFLSNFTYINNCYGRTSCSSYNRVIEISTKVPTYTTVYVDITNSTFDNLTGDLGVYVRDNTKYNVDNLTVKNCKYRNGIFHILYSDPQSSTSLNIEDSYFLNNYGNSGVIIDVIKIKSEYNNDIIINNSVFEGNRAYNYGGVIYIPNENTFQYSLNDSRILFNNCTFINNSAKK
eukprot:jgi/Orpsp1_1/1191577/evm.model.d7180000087121.1